MVGSVPRRGTFFGGGQGLGVVQPGTAASSLQLRRRLGAGCRLPPEPDLQARFGQPEPMHPAQAIGTLGCAEHRFDLGTRVAHLGVVRLQPREHRRTTPGARMHDAGRPAPSADRCLKTVLP